MGAKLPHKKKDFKPCSGFDVSFYSQAYGVSMGMAIHFFIFYFYLFLVVLYHVLVRSTRGSCNLYLTFLIPRYFSFEFPCSNTYPLYTSPFLCDRLAFSVFSAEIPRDSGHFVRCLSFVPLMYVFVFCIRVYSCCIAFFHSCWKGNMLS